MRTLLTIGLATLLVACEDNESTPVESKIIIETREVLEPTSRRLTFFCKSEKIYPCVNYPILTDNDLSGDPFKIRFVSIDDNESMVCFPAPGPATTVVDLSTIPNGEYDIEFSNEGLRNKGLLKVSDTDIDLSFGLKMGIEFVRSNTKRVPHKTYWGVIGYHVQESSALVDAFIQKFVDKGVVFDKQTPGHYFYYEIDNSGDIVNDVENSGYYFQRSVIFQYDGDESEIKNIIEVDGKNYQVDLSINFYSYKGEYLNNWE